jgi:hypothetical protein
MTVTAMIDDVMSNSCRNAATSATYLLHRRLATATTPSNKPRGQST